MMNGHHARTNNKNRRLPSPSPESSSGRSMLVSRPNGGSDYRGLSDCQTASQSIAIHRGSRATSSTDTKMVVGSFAASTVLSTTASFISSVSSVASSWSRDDVDQVERLRADISTSRRSGRLLRFLSSRQIADEIERVRQVRLWKYDQSRILRDHEAELAAMERSLLERLSQKPPTEKHDELPSKNIVGNPPHRRDDDHDDTARCFSVASRPQSLRGAITDLHPNRSSTERQEPWGVAGIVSVLMQLDNSLKTRVLEFVPDECFANLPQLGAYAVKGASVPVRLCFGPARPTSAFATNTTSTSPSLSSLHHSHMNTQNGDDQKKIVDQLLNAGGHRWGLGESRGILIHRAAADYVGHKDGSVLGGEDCDVDIAFGRACLAAAARRRVALTAERACDASSDRYGDRKRRRSVSLLLLPRGGDRNRGRLSPLHHDSGYLGNEWNRNEENNKDGSYNGAIGPDGCLHHFDDDDEEDHECAICDWNNRRADVHILSLKDAGQPWTAHLDEAHRDFYQQGAEGNGRCILSGRRSTCSSGVGDKSSAQGRHRAVLEAYCERPLPTTCEQQSRAPLSFEWLDQTGVEAQVKHLAVVAPLLDSLLDFARPNQESQFDAEETQSSSAFEFVDEETPAMMTSLTSDLAAERLSSFLASPTSRVVGGGAIGSSRLSPLKQQKGRAKASRRGAFAMGTVYEEIPSGDENSRAAATDERLRHHLAPTSSSSMIKQLKGENKFLLSVPIGSLQCPDSPLHEAADLQLVSDGSSSSGDDMELRCRGTGAFELDVQDDGEDSFDDSKGAELSAGDAASSSRTAPSDRHVGLVGRTDLGVRQSSGSAPSISPSDGNSDIVVASCGEPAFPLPHLGTQNKGRWPGQPKSSPSSSSQFCHSLPAMALRKTTTSKKKGRMMAVTVPDNSMLAHLPATAFKFPLVPLSLTLTPTYFPADCDCCSNSLCQKCSDLPCRDAVVDGLDFLNDGHRSLMKLDERVDSWVRHTGPSRCRMMQAFDWARRGCESINPTRGVSLPPTETHALLRQMSAPEGSDLMSPFASPSSRVAGSGRRRRQQKLDDQSQQHGLRMGAGNSSSIRHHAANMPTPLAGTRSQSTIAAVAGEAAAGGLLSNITAVDNLVDFSTLEVLKLNPVLLNNANTSRARHWLHMVAEAASHRQTKPTTTFPGLGGGLQTLSTAAGLHICLEQRKLVNASSMLLLERNFVSSSMRKQCQHSVTLLAENLRETLTWSEADALSGLRLREIIGRLVPKMKLPAGHYDCSTPHMVFIVDQPRDRPHRKFHPLVQKLPIFIFPHIRTVSPTAFRALLPAFSVAESLSLLDIFPTANLIKETRSKIRQIASGGILSDSLDPNEIVGFFGENENSIQLSMAADEEGFVVPTCDVCRSCSAVGEDNCFNLFWRQLVHPFNETAAWVALLGSFSSLEVAPPSSRPPPPQPPQMNGFQSTIHPWPPLRDVGGKPLVADFLESPSNLFLSNIVCDPSSPSATGGLNGFIRTPSAAAVDHSRPTTTKPPAGSSGVPHMLTSPHATTHDDYRSGGASAIGDERTATTPPTNAIRFPYLHDLILAPYCPPSATLDGACSLSVEPNIYKISTNVVAKPPQWFGSPHYSRFSYFRQIREALPTHDQRLGLPHHANIARLERIVRSMWESLNLPQHAPNLHFLQLTVPVSPELVYLPSVPRSLKVLRVDAFTPTPDRTYLHRLAYAIRALHSSSPNHSSSRCCRRAAASYCSSVAAADIQYGGNVRCGPTGVHPPSSLLSPRRKPLPPPPCCGISSCLHFIRACECYNIPNTDHHRHDAPDVTIRDPPAVATRAFPPSRPTATRPPSSSLSTPSGSPFLRELIIEINLFLLWTAFTTEVPMRSHPAACGCTGHAGRAPEGSDVTATTCGGSPNPTQNHFFYFVFEVLSEFIEIVPREITRIVFFDVTSTAKTGPFMVAKGFCPSPDFCLAMQQALCRAWNPPSFSPPDDDAKTATTTISKNIPSSGGLLSSLSATGWPLAPAPPTPPSLSHSVFSGRAVRATTISATSPLSPPVEEQIASSHVEGSSSVVRSEQQPNSSTSSAPPTTTLPDPLVHTTRASSCMFSPTSMSCRLFRPSPSSLLRFAASSFLGGNEGEDERATRSPVAADDDGDLRGAGGRPICRRRPPATYGAMQSTWLQSHFRSIKSPFPEPAYDSERNGDSLFDDNMAAGAALPATATAVTTKKVTTGAESLSPPSPASSERQNLPPWGETLPAAALLLPAELQRFYCRTKSFRNSRTPVGVSSSPPPPPEATTADGNNASATIGLNDLVAADLLPKTIVTRTSNPSSRTADRGAAACIGLRKMSQVEEADLRIRLVQALPRPPTVRSGGGCDALSSSSPASEIFVSNPLLHRRDQPQPKGASLLTPPRLPPRLGMLGTPSDSAGPTPMRLPSLTWGMEDSIDDMCGDKDANDVVKSATEDGHASDTTTRTKMTDTATQQSELHDASLASKTLSVLLNSNDDGRNGDQESAPPRLWSVERSRSADEGECGRATAIDASLHEREAYEDAGGAVDMDEAAGVFSTRTSVVVSGSAAGRVGVTVSASASTTATKTSSHWTKDETKSEDGVEVVGRNHTNGCCGAKRKEKLRTFVLMVGPPARGTTYFRGVNPTA